MHQSGSVSLCRSAISVLVATALYSPIALASTVEYGETVDGVVLEKDIQLVYGTANNTKINPGGEQHIKEFGVSNNTEINGGYQYIEMTGAAEYSVLNDGYQIVQMGGAANQTTLNNGVLQVYGAANDTTIKGGRLIVEKDGGAVFVAIEKGGLLEVKEGGFAFAVDQKAGGAIKTTTRAMEVFGTNRLGQFDIKNGIANNMLLENGGSLRVEENDFAYNTTVDSGGLLEVMDGGTVTGVDKKAGGKLIVSTNALEVSMNWMMVPGSLLWRTRRPLILSLISMPLCNRWERILVRKCRQMRYMISVDHIRMEVSRIPQKPSLKIWLSTMAALTSGLAQWLTFQSEGMMAFLRS